jgi:hypothetical protein
MPHRQNKCKENPGTRHFVGRGGERITLRSCFRELCCETEEMVSARRPIHWDQLLSTANTSCTFLLQRLVKARAGQDGHVALCPSPRNASTRALLRPRDRTWSKAVARATNWRSSLVWIDKRWVTCHWLLLNVSRHKCFRVSRNNTVYIPCLEMPISWTGQVSSHAQAVYWSRPLAISRIWQICPLYHRRNTHICPLQVAGSETNDDSWWFAFKCDWTNNSSRIWRHVTGNRFPPFRRHIFRSPSLADLR